MLCSVVVAVLLSAAPTKPVSLALPGLKAPGFPVEQADFFTEHLALHLRRQGFEVVTPREIASLLGLERQKQLLGCTDASSSCMAEIANALGTDGVVLGDVARIGDRIQINLKALNSGTGKALATFAEPASSDGAVLDVLMQGARELRPQIAAALGREITPQAIAKSGPSPVWWVPGAIGLAAAGGGLALILSGNGVVDTLAREGATLDESKARALVQGGQLQQGLGVALLGVGAAGLATSVVLLVATGGRQSVALVPVREGAVVTVGGVW